MIFKLNLYKEYLLYDPFEYEFINKSNWKYSGLKHTLFRMILIILEGKCSYLFRFYPDSSFNFSFEFHRNNLDVIVRKPRENQIIKEFDMHSYRAYYQFFFCAEHLCVDLPNHTFLRDPGNKLNFNKCEIVSFKKFPWPRKYFSGLIISTAVIVSEKILYPCNFFI